MSKHLQEASGFGSLLERAWGGDRDAENALFEKLHARILALAKKRIWDEESARDLAQETLRTAFEKYRQIDRQRSFLPWVVTIFHNKAGNYIKKRQTQRKHLESGDVPPAWSSADTFAGDEGRVVDLVEWVERALLKASSDCRTIFRLLLLEAGRKDIHDAFPGESPGAVDSRISRCRDKLLREMERLGGEKRT
jgi:RNA polymerase sigma-70 factor, ECF subfamily